jgi:uncharacterized protein YjcR
MQQNIDKISIKDPFLDRRSKLLPCQKEMVQYWYNEKGMAIKAIARMFKVSPRTIHFILFPERKEANMKKWKERGGWKQYYDKDTRAADESNYKAYKKKIFGGKENE